MTNATPRKVFANGFRMHLACALLALVVIGTGVRNSAIHGQVFTAPNAHVENVSFESVGGGVIYVYYDLVSDSSSALFTVRLQVSDDGGKTFSMTPAAITGDVVGVSPGRRKKIVWQSGQDVSVLPGANALRFNVIPTTFVGNETGAVQIRTTPEGAAVKIDGESKGTTPVTIRDVTAGSHRIVISKDGYLENSSEITVVAKQTATVEKTLTPGSGQGGGKKPSSPMKWIIPVAGGGAAAAAFALHGGSGATTTTTTIPCTPTSLPAPTISDNLNGATPIANVTTVTFTGSASGTWTESGTALATNSTAATLVLKDINAHTVTLTISSTSPCQPPVTPVTASASRTVQAKDLTGNWRSQDSTGAVRFIEITQQNGTSLVGSFCLGTCTSTSRINGTGSLAQPRAISFSAVQGTGGIVIESSLATNGGIDNTVGSFTGKVTGPTGSVAASQGLILTFIKQ
jgi:hypothetical protein